MKIWMNWIFDDCQAINYFLKENKKAHTCQTPNVSKKFGWKVHNYYLDLPLDSHSKGFKVIFAKIGTSTNLGEQPHYKQND